MKRRHVLALILGALGGAGGWFGSRTHAEPIPAPLYYQDPNGEPFYSAIPKKTRDGRNYIPVFKDKATSPGANPPASPSTKRPGGSRRILYYRDPMGLPDASPHPKKDSMGMDYVPVYADAAGDAPGTVRIGPGRIQTLGVRTEPVELSSTLTSTVRATGYLQYDERHLATVSTKVAGWLEHLNVAATGDPVRRGEALAQIYSPELVASEQEYLDAARMRGAVGALTPASLQRLRALDVSRQEIDRLRRIGVASRRIAIRAPEDGVVIEQAAQKGMYVNVGQLLYKTARLSPLWLIAEVQEQDIGAIKLGEKASANFVAFPNRTFEGTVNFIYPSLTSATRTARVRIVVPNADHDLRASMYASVKIDIPGGGQPMATVPESAVLNTGRKQIALVERGGGRFEPRPVKLGAHGGGRVQVLHGLKVGERVVVDANFLIDAESNLRAALQSFSDADKANLKNNIDPKASKPGAAP